MPYPGSHHYDESFESEDVNPDSSYMFTTQQPHSPSSIYPTSAHDSPHSWTPFDQTLLPPFQSQPLPYRAFPTPAPYAAPRLSSPLNSAGGGHVATNMSRLSLAGSLDPATGIFYRTPEHPRLRTAQACEKCRTRKAKCSGEHPSCKRCINRGLVCEYAKEGRVRGPNKIKTGISSSTLKHPGTPGSAELEQNGRILSCATSSPVEQGGVSSLASDASTIQESPITRISSEECSPHSPSIMSLNTLTIQSPPRVKFTPLSQHSSPHPGQISRDPYPAAVSSGQSSRRGFSTTVSVGLGEHRAFRPRPPNLGLDANDQWRQGSTGGNSPSVWTHQTNTGVNLNDMAEFGMDLQDPQQQYERQRLARQQHQRFLEEQQQLAAYQQRRMLQQPGTSVPMDYPGVQPQPSSLPIVPTTLVHQHQHMNPAIDSMFQTQYQAYTPNGGFGGEPTMEYAHPLHPEIQTQRYPEESRAASAMTHQESYQREATGLESTEQGLHPSLSRVDRRLETQPGGSNGGESSVGFCPSDLRHQGITNGDQSRWV